MMSDSIQKSLEQLLGMEVSGKIWEVKLQSAPGMLFALSARFIHRVLIL